MITIIEGKGLGSGKSAFVVELCMDHWVNGGTAYVSQAFQVKWDECKRYAKARWGWKLEDDQFKEVASEDIFRLHEVTPPGTADCPVLIVVDEAQDQLDVRDYAEKSKKGLFSFICQSRHDDNDLIFATQNARNIDARVRRLATYTWSTRNLLNFKIQGIGNLGSIIKAVTFGLNSGFYFYRAQLDYDGVTQIDGKLVKADIPLLNCYESKSMRGKHRRAGAAVARKKLEREKGTHPMWKWAILACMAICVWGGWQLFSGTSKKVLPKAAVTSVGPEQAATIRKETVNGIEARANRGAYEIRKESWLAAGRGWLKTRSGFYKPGEMSADGFVEGVRDKIVRVRKPDNGLLYIIGEDYSVPIGPGVKDKNAVADRDAAAAPKEPIVVAAPKQPELTMAASWR